MNNLEFDNCILRIMFCSLHRKQICAAAVFVCTFISHVCGQSTCSSGFDRFCGGSVRPECVTQPGVTGNCKCCPTVTTTTTTTAAPTTTTTTPALSTTTSTAAPTTSSTTAYSTFTTTAGATATTTAIAPNTTTTTAALMLTVSTTALSSSGSTVDQLTCRCECVAFQDFKDRYLSSSFENLTEQEQQMALAEKVFEIQTKLTVPKANLSSTIRKKTSAQDNRPASKAVGMSLGIGITCFILGSVVLSDIQRLFQHIHQGASVR